MCIREPENGIAVSSETGWFGVTHLAGHTLKPPALTLCRQESHAQGTHAGNASALDQKYELLVCHGSDFP